MDESKKSCVTCCWYEGRSSFCRLNPPQIMLDKDGYYVTCWPKITCPMLDYCSHYDNINKKKLI